VFLAIDIGNTNITCGIFRGNRIIKKFNIPTKKFSQKKLKQSIGKTTIRDSIICSVVPTATKIVERAIKSVISGKVYILGRNIKASIKNLYRSPREVGQDRLVNAYAGVSLYGAPLIIIDFGTAITFDVISKRAEYLGGMIIPGLRISLETLTEKTALLPRLELAMPKELIGRDTKNSMLSGIVYGFAALSDDLTSRIKQKIGERAKVVVTGGNVDLISRYCKKFDYTNKDLTLLGLNMIYLKKIS